MILSEFGGYGMEIGATKRDEFSYKKYITNEELTEAIVKLYETQIIPAKKRGLAASIYTQVSDVEQEVNGLLSYDRKTVKVIEEDIAKMSERLLSEN